MILMKWFNVYLTLDGFRLGKSFDTHPDAIRNTNEFRCYHETTVIPTEILGEPLYTFNARIRTYEGTLNQVCG